ncbi:carbamoyltransferase N-terminal domain-containing protein (plasmid) [Limimaricola variabilis]|uniref:carbamoyltransferase N-terminal domain-containing protein n=1 Tax=Limimaricola variabilis TaxID=1492771 RepID=UPI002AC9E32B|nr:carbamoyltransferase N-terminal domain-containing protein [Limimaricola variabilis]WPY96241.1 carbamoyltransferase N-terminal domain-containing protein [Limimaricola variabilis]
MTAIFGLNAFHADSSACPFIHGKFEGAVAEERLGPRNKHAGAFPENAIRWLLSDARIRRSDVSHVAVAREFDRTHDARIGARAERQTETAATLANLPEVCSEDPPRRKYEIYNVEHLLAHIASAYYLSPFDTVVGLSYDGSSDFASPMTERCEDLKNDILDRVSLPNSLGHDYTAMCQFIGFDLFGEEDKVMGLAPYGEDLYAAQMAWIVQPDAA